MRNLLLGTVVLAALLAAATAAPVIDQPRGVPVLRSVEPSSGKTGDLVTAFGEYLDTSCLAALYLTNGKVDLKAEITEQDEGFVKFKIPEAAPGRYRLMLLMRGKEPTLWEQPVTLTVE